MASDFNAPGDVRCSSGRTVPQWLAPSWYRKTTMGIVSALSSISMKPSTLRSTGKSPSLVVLKAQAVRPTPP